MLRGLTTEVPKLCILTAGRGTRMGALTGGLNKALLPVKRKALISHILDRFPERTEVVVALGHLGHQVQNYLMMAHPGRKFHWVFVDRVEGAGSGPGYSLLRCEEALRCPFYFVACDTYWENDTTHLGLENDWFGVARVPLERAANYCNLVLDGFFVKGVIDKVAPTVVNTKAFTGLAYIHNHETFWTGLREGLERIDGEIQLSSGIKAVVEKHSPLALDLSWWDAGNPVSYAGLCGRFEAFDFSKPDEALYIFDRRVIKFYADEEIASLKVKRAELCPGVFPSIREQKGQFYTYDYVPGRTLYEWLDPPLFRRFLEWMESSFWKRSQASPEMVRKACHKFYREKTEDRLNAYFARYPDGDWVRGIRERHHGEEAVDEVGVPSLKEVLGKVPWLELERGEASFVHGDLQFDNILFDGATDRFTLIDWRHDFAGHLYFGDLHYDLAKLFGGMLLDYSRIRSGELQFSRSGSTAEVETPTVPGHDDYIATLKTYTQRRAMDFARVEIITGLVYLNMAPLHRPPFDQALFALGKKRLWKSLN